MTRRMLAPWLLAAVALLLAASTGLPAARAEPQAKTYYVNDKGHDPDANPGDSVCATAAGVCTLDAAIDESNNDLQPSTIRFSRRFQDSDYIDACGLELHEDNTTIDASDQWDTVYDRPGVEVRGNCVAFAILTIYGSEAIVRGLDVSGGNTAIRISGDGHNTVGGPDPGQRNLLLGTGGVEIWGGDYNTIDHNYLGTREDSIVRATAGERVPSIPGAHAGTNGYLDNGWILVESDHNTVSYNVIANSPSYGTGTGIGIKIEGEYNTVTDNTIGLAAPGQEARSMERGIYMLNADYNTIGPRNLICGNATMGIEIRGGQDNTITQNTIGDHWSRDQGNQGEGIKIDGAHNTQLLHNVINFNGSHGLWVVAGDVTAYGNDFDGNGGDGIYLLDGGSTIGGPGAGMGSEIGGTLGLPGAGEGNEISGNLGNGVHLDGAGAVTISGNCIGLKTCVYEQGNQVHGILLENGSANNTIGGDGEGEGNWIGWNGEDGIRLIGDGTTFNFVQGNVIGAASNWAFSTPNGAGIGIYFGADGNWIGGLGERMGNTILANESTGLSIVAADDTIVLGNHIGTDGAGHDWGNESYGVLIAAVGSTLSQNEIAFNGTHAGEAGVYIFANGATGNALIGNSIHDHEGKGISLANGGNAELDAPAIQQASCQGPLSGTACPGCQVEIFSDADDEGKVLEASITADAAGGAFSWNGLPSGPHVTATARDGDDNTSEFSEPYAVGLCNSAPTAAFVIRPASGMVGTLFTFDASSSSDVEDPASALQVRWDWDNDGVYDVAWTTAKTAKRSFDQAAFYTIRLQVKDTGGLTDAATKQLDVEDLVLGRVFLPIIMH